MAVPIRRRRAPALATAPLLLLAAAAGSLAPRPAAAAAPADSTRYLIEEDGGGVGWFSVSRTRDAQGRLVYRGTGEKPGAWKLRRLEVVTGADWVPVSAFYRLSRGGRSVEIATTFQDGKAISTGKADGSKIPVPDAKFDGPLFVLPGNGLPAFAALADFLAKQDAAKYKGSLKAFATPLVVDLEVAGLGTRTVPSATGQAEVRAFSLEFRVPRQRGQTSGQTYAFEMHLAPDGRLHGFHMPEQKIRVYPMPADATIAGAAPSFPEVALKFASGPDSLAGALMLPAKDPAKPGPYGAVVFVSGSGPSDRDETVADFPVFRALAEKLAAAGYASLRYDDRGVGDSGGDYGLVTMDILAADAAAAVAALRARPEIDPARVGVLGHSEGAMLAPQVCALVADGAGRAPWCAVLLAGSTRRGRDIILSQQEHGLAAGGFAPDVAERKRVLQRQVFAWADGRADWASVVALADTSEAEALETQKAFLEAPWFKSFLDYDPVPWLKRLQVPVLVLHGELDRQLPAADGAALRDTLRAAGNQRVSYAPVRGVNHLFQVAKTGEAEEYGALKKEFAAGVAERVPQFLAMCDRIR